MKTNALFALALTLVCGSPFARAEAPTNANFGFNFATSTQIETNAWLIDRPYYYNGSTRYWLVIDDNQQSGQDLDKADVSICKKLGFNTARPETRTVGSPWNEKTFNIATINARAEIIGLDKDLSGVLPTGFIYARLICMK